MLAEVLQNLILIRPFSSEKERSTLYLSFGTGPDGPVPAAGGLALRNGQAAGFTTFFNAFSHKKWQAEADLKSIGLRLDGSGDAKIVFKAYDANGKEFFIHEVRADISLSEVFWLDGFRDFPGTILGFELTAVSGDVRLTAGAWVTRDSPRREVRLAAVITTFNRQEAALNAIGKFSKITIPQAGSDELRLFVIDNGQNLATEAVLGVTVVPNKNLGGSGGFTRGLLLAREQGATHALFMDDDASCEPESVLRTIKLFRYLTDAKAAVNGSFMIETSPTRLYEKNGRFPLEAPWKSKDYTWMGVCHGLDLGERRDLAFKEDAPDGNYGAWPFFAFPLAAAEQLPFPFFVRGDDIDFSLINRLRIVSFNGIATWADDFDDKESAATKFLNARSTTALHFIHSPLSKCVWALVGLVRYAFVLGRRSDYGGMFAMLDGVNFTLNGPAAYGDEPSPFRHLKRAKGRYAFATVPPEQLEYVSSARGTKGALYRVINALTLRGHLLPRFLRTKPAAAILGRTDRSDVFMRRGYVVRQGRRWESHPKNSRAFLLGALYALATLARGVVFAPICKHKFKQHTTYRTHEYWTRNFS